MMKESKLRINIVMGCGYLQRSHGFLWAISWASYPAKFFHFLEKETNLPHEIVIFTPNLIGQYGPIRYTTNIEEMFQGDVIVFCDFHHLEEIMQHKNPSSKIVLLSMFINVDIRKFIDTYGNFPIITVNHNTVLDYGMNMSDIYPPVDVWTPTEINSITRLHRIMLGANWDVQRQLESLLAIYDKFPEEFHLIVSRGKGCNLDEKIHKRCEITASLPYYEYRKQLQSCGWHIRVVGAIYSATYETFLNYTYLLSHDIYFHGVNDIRMNPNAAMQLNTSTSSFNPDSVIDYICNLVGNPEKYLEDVYYNVKNIAPVFSPPDRIKDLILKLEAEA